MATRAKKSLNLPKNPFVPFRAKNPSKRDKSLDLATLDRATGQGQEVGSEGGGEAGEAQPGLAILNVELVPTKFKHRILNAL